MSRRSSRSIHRSSTSTLHPTAGWLAPWHLLHPNISLLCCTFRWSSRPVTSLHLLLQKGQVTLLLSDPASPPPSIFTPSALLSSIFTFLLSSFSRRSLELVSLLCSLFCCFLSLSSSLPSSSFLSCLSSGGVGLLLLPLPRGTRS